MSYNKEKDERVTDVRYRDPLVFTARSQDSNSLLVQRVMGHVSPPVPCREDPRDNTGQGERWMSREQRTRYTGRPGSPGAEGRARLRRCRA